MHEYIVRIKHVAYSYVGVAVKLFFPESGGKSYSSWRFKASSNWVSVLDCGIEVFVSVISKSSSVVLVDFSCSMIKVQVQPTLVMTTCWLSSGIIDQFTKKIC